MTPARSSGLRPWLKTALLIILVATAILVVPIFITAMVWKIRNGDRWTPGREVSEAQIRRITAALASYAAEHGERPMRLAQLVQHGYLGAESLFDGERGQLPGIDANTGRFTVNPDVLYFPGVEPNDPGDLVLLCTLLVRDRGDPYHVIYNDGRYEAMAGRQLIRALNRTYTHVARATWGEPPTDANSASGS
ncbi:MAG TPA: hypothetical protein VNA25_08855 [Phycisphaerae bacterium]|nr:hypothetical protein [Phycisphaerae bacterium]